MASLGFLGWSFWQARRTGRVGILAWLQAVVLVAPWLVFFAFTASGIFLNPIILFAVLTLTTGAYIWIGRTLREAARLQELELRERYREQQLSVGEGGGEQTIPLEALESETVAIPKADQEGIRALFGIDTFFATESLPFRQGVLFKGNLRGDPEIVHQALSEKLQILFAGRYRLFLLADEENRPTMLVLPTERDPFDTRKVPTLVIVALGLLSAISVLLLSGSIYQVDPFVTPGGLWQIFPVTVGILLTLLAHEVAHRLQARRYGVRMSAPYFLPLLTPLPVPPTGFVLAPGTFGSLTRFSSPPPTRRALFDIALAGPAAGGLLSLACLVIGLFFSETTTQAVPFMPRPEGIGVLVGTLVRLIVGPIGAGELVLFHPLAVIGIVGLQITALNLLPAGQLDGGRIVQAVYGRKTARITGIVTLVILGVGGFFVSQFFYWAVIVFLFARAPERPALNELTETDARRDALAIVVLFVMAAVLLPLTPQIALRLGLGG